MYEFRRRFLKLAGSVGALAISAATGLTASRSAWAAWNNQAFGSKVLADALRSLGAANAVPSKEIVIIVPDVAENAAVVPVAITSKIANTQSISILSEKNPFPLAATFDVANGAEPYASIRIKVGQTSDVWAVVKADGKYFTAKREVKITAGGCA